MVRTTWTDKATGVTHEVAVDLPPAQFSRRLQQSRGWLVAKPGQETSCGLALSGPLRVDPHAAITCEDACGQPEPHPLAPRSMGDTPARRSLVAVGGRARGVA